MADKTGGQNEFFELNYIYYEYICIYILQHT